MNSKIIYIVIGIIVFILLCILFYYYYYAPNQSNVAVYKIPLITDEIHFDEAYYNTIILKAQPSVSTRDTLYVPKLGFGLSFVWEMYVPSVSSNDKWQTSYNRLKPIISISDSPVISYHPKKNYLSVVLKYRNNPFYAQFAELKYENIKPQRWSKYILIIENRDVKLYIDNLLVSVKTLPSVPVIYDIATNITLGNLNNNFQGKIRNASLYPYPLSYIEIDSV
jgi:hypothetical protein